MDDTSRELLKQIQGMISTSENKLCTDIAARSEAVERSMEILSNDFNAWRPKLEARVDKLQSAVLVLQQQTTGKLPLGVATTPVGGDPPAARLTNARGLDAHPLVGVRPAGVDLGQGLGESMLHRGVTIGAPAAPTFSPVTGTANFQTPMNSRSAVFDSDKSVNQLLTHMGHANPSLQFPVFDGDNPQMWQTLAEQYFSMFSVHESYWVSM